MKLRNNTESIPNHGAPRDAAIFQDLDLVNRIARRFQRRVPPCVTFDDLASAGMIGLIHAVDRFDQTRGLKFRTYAQHRIQGAMQDFLHDGDPLSRTERQRVRTSAPALSATGYGVPPATVGLDQIPVRCLASTAQPAFTLRAEVREARRCLSPRENRVIELPGRGGSLTLAVTHRFLRRGLSPIFVRLRHVLQELREWDVNLRVKRE